MQLFPKYAVLAWENKMVRVLKVLIVWERMDGPAANEVGDNNEIICILTFFSISNPSFSV